MRTTLLLNDLCRVLSGLVLSMAACHMACAEAGHDWKVLVGKQAAVKVDRKQVRVERSLQARLRHAEAASFLPLDLGAGSTESSWRWLLVREASRVRGDAGFCGAGHEDHLLLVKVTKSVGTAIDDFLAQSCLKSISMDMDQFNELMSAISIDKQARQLSLQQAVSSDTASFRQDVRIEVISGRMNVIVRKLAD
jgi:hypothetical protein